MDQLSTTLKDFLAFTGLNDSIAKLLSALLILFIGWMIAKGIRKLVYRALKKTTWDDKLLGKAAGNADPNAFFSTLVYYLLMLLVLMVVLEAMGISQVLDPLKNMLNEFFGYFPRIIAAGVIGFIGYIIATFASNLISMTGNLMDNVALKAGFTDTKRLTDIVRKVIFFIIFVLFIIQALNALGWDAITGPANEVLQTILGTLPKILGASLIIGIFAYGGRFLTNFIEDILRSIGTDSLPERLQLAGIMGEGQSLSRIIGNLAFFFLVAFGIITGVEMLELDKLSGILNTVLSTTGQILFGLVVLVLGNYIATLIYDALSKSANNQFIASIARFAIIGLFLAISLRTMGIANSIVELAFGLTLGAVAVAFALAYGLGGREAAGEHAKELLSKLKNK